MITIFHSQSLRYEYTRYDETEENTLALQDVNIRIDRGEFVAILGHNGSGKSTLARHLNALLVPTEGTLWVKDMDSKEPQNAWPIRQLSGMVFQNPDNQLVATIVEEDVAFGPENLGVPSEEIRQRVDDALDSVRMSHYASAAPHQLSGGQKQRIAIAGVLAMRPDCIVLDEPTAMLDPSGRQEVIETVLRLNKASGITVILITHFMEEAVKAGRVIVMDKGTVVMDGVPRKIFRQVEKMKGLGLDVPSATALAHALRQQGMEMPDDILTEDEFISHFVKDNYENN
ncbi:MAG: energy-coupling factor transporter ATPase [Defluviitaleaceae bacterium]|nr:energy-coupling factor transporter ATPase [Defluviitaleaceae bacterium]